VNSILTIKPADFDRINNETSAVAFMQQLLWAEAYRIGLPLSSVNISLNTKIPDGGIDATVMLPPANCGTSSIITDGYTTYQIKAGKSFAPWQESAIRKELYDKQTPAREHLGEMVRDALDSNGRYVLIDFGHDLTSGQRGTAVNLLETSLRQDCGYQHPKVDVWSRNNLTSYLIPFPSLVLNLIGLSRDFQTHGSWANDDNMRVAFVPGASQKRQIQALQDALRQGTFHVRVTGEPGIGKTRLVFEVTKADDLRPLVIYSNAELLWNSPLLNALIQEDAEYSAIFVIDECNPERRALITNKLKAHSPRIRMISIYSEPESSSSTRILELDPLGLEEVSRIIEGYQVPGDIAQKWAPECGGSPRVANLVGLNLLNNPEDMLREPDTERVWDRFIEGSDDPRSEEVRQRRTVLMYVSLFKRFGFSDPVSNEARGIHKLVHEYDPTITWPRFVEIINDLRSRKLLQGETTLYITPKLLQIKLWVDWWDTTGARIEINHILSISSQALIDWFIEMFEYAAGSEAAVKTVSELLGSHGPFRADLTLLQSERGARFFRYLGEVNPEAAVRCLQTSIGTWDRESLLKFTEGRRDVIYLLERTARWRNLFAPSAELLLKLAEAENESWVNNASGVFAELFTISGHPKLSVTETPVVERFPILEKALDSASPQERKIAIEACNRALHERIGGSVDRNVRVFHREPQLWVPATWSEVFDAFRLVWRLLMSKLDRMGTEEHQRISNILIENTQHLGAFPSLAEMIAHDIMVVASKPYVDGMQIFRVVTELLRYNKNLAPEVRSTWERVRDNLIGSDYHSHMKRYVGMYLAEDFVGDSDARTREQQAKLQELVRESIEYPNLFHKEMSWLVTDSAVNGYQFGYALAVKDSAYDLLPEIVERQKSHDGVSGMYFLSGYLRNMFEQRPQAWEQLMDQFAQDLTTASWIPGLTHRAGQISSRAARRVLNALTDWSLPIELLDQFIYGNTLNSLPVNLFTEWLEFLLNHEAPNAAYVALVLCDRYYASTDATAVISRDLTLKLLTSDSFESMPESVRHGNLRSMIPFYWESLANAFVQLYPEDSLKISAYLLHYFERFDTFLSDDRPRSILRAIIALFPEAVWNQITPYLESSLAVRLRHWLRGDDFFGQPGEQDLPVLPLFPREHVWQWVKGDVEERAWCVAACVPPSFDEHQPEMSWARELLVRYGGRDDVRRNLRATFSSGGWLGDESAHLAKKKQQLLRYRELESDRNVCLWLDEYIEYLDENIKSARIVEERIEF